MHESMQNPALLLGQEKKKAAHFVAQNCVKIMRDIEKLEPLSDGVTHFQLILKTQNTRTQYTDS